MKYNLLGFNQRKLVVINRKLIKNKFSPLDMEDLTLLRWFIDFKATDKMVRAISDKDNKEYYWVKYESVRDEFPFFRINTNDSIYRRFQKIVKAGLLIHFPKKDKDGTFSYYNTTDDLYNLMYERYKETEDNSDESSDGYGADYGAYNPSVKEPSITELSKDNLVVSENETTCTNNFKKPNIQPDSLENHPTSLEGPVEQPVKAINFPPEKQSPVPIEKQKLSQAEKTRLKYGEKLVTSNKYMDYWNSKPNLTKHKPGTEVYHKSAVIFNQLESGIFGKFHREVDCSMLEENKVPIDVIHKKWTEKEIYTAIDRVDFMQTPKYSGFHNPSTQYYKSCLYWLLNGNKKSYALISLYKEPDRAVNKQSSTDPEVLVMYQKTLNIKESDDLYPDLVRGVNVIVSRKAEYDKKYGRYININIFDGHNFFRQHLNFLEKSDRKYLPNDILYMYHVNHWKNFNDWLKNKFNKGYTLFPTETMINEAKQKFEENEKSAKVREVEEKERERELQEFLERQKNRPANRFQVAAG